MASESLDSHHHEIKAYVKSFTDSSNRVRYVLFATTIASIFSFVVFLNSDPNGWIDNRLRVARAALHDLAAKEAADGAGRPAAVKRAKRPLELPTSPLLENAQEWLQLYGLTSAQEVEKRLEKMEETEIRDVMFVRVPFLNIAFDINDMAIVAAISFAFLMLVLVFSMSRQHENLYLCLWKVKEACDREARPNDGHSEANLFYHALAMAQVFSKPPSLGRWNLKWSPRASYALLLLPLLAMFLIVDRDSETMDFAAVLNDSALARGTLFEFAGLLFIIFCTVRCLIYAHSADLRWKIAFFHLNPGYLQKAQPSASKWLKTERFKPRMAVFADGDLENAAGRRQRLSELINGKDSLVIFEDDRRPGWSADVLATAADYDLLIVRISKHPAADPLLGDVNGELAAKWRTGGGTVGLIRSGRELLWHIWDPDRAELSAKLSGAGLARAVRPSSSPEGSPGAPAQHQQAEPGSAGLAQA